jgi:hypothetical protein
MMSEDYYNDTLTYLQEALTGLTKSGYYKEYLLECIEIRNQNILSQMILDDTEGMNVGEIREYLTTLIKK